MNAQISQIWITLANYEMKNGLWIVRNWFAKDKVDNEIDDKTLDLVSTQIEDPAG